MTTRSFSSPWLTIVLPLALGGTAHAAGTTNGTWSTDSAGNWSDTTKWTSGIIADGTDAIADFSTLNIAAGRTVTLNANRTVGTLKFDDTGATGDSAWTISTATSNVLTLATSSAAPTINVGSTGIANTFASHTISTPISGTQGLSVTGANPLSLSGDLTNLSGTLNIIGGRVSLGTGTSLGGITSVDVKAGGQLGLWNANSSTAANITIAGTGYGENTFEVALRLGNASCNTTLEGTVTLSANAAIGGRNGAGFSNTFNGAIGDTGSPYTLTFGAAGLSNGTYVLNGTNTYTGATTITNGTVQIGNAGSLGSGTYAGNLANAGTFRYSSSANQTLSGIISGTGALAKDFDTNSTLTLSGVNTYTGATTISAGTLRVATLANGGVASNIGAASTAAGNLVFGGGTLQYTGPSTTTDRAFNVTGNSILDLTSAGTVLTIANGVATGVSGTAALSKAGPGKLVLGGGFDNAGLVLAVATGEVELAKTGTTSRGVAGLVSIAPGATVKLTGTGGDQIYGGSNASNRGVNGLEGTLDLNGRSESTSNFNGTETGVVTNSAAATNAVWTVGETNATSAFDGTIQDGAGTVSLVKIGTGIQELSGANTYTGTTTLNGGILSLDYDSQNNSKLSNAGLVLNGGTIELYGDLGNHVENVGPVTINGAVSITRLGANTAKIALGNFTNNGTLDVGSAGLATTTVANNAAGYLTGVTFGGTEFAAKDGLGNIVAATSLTYTDVARTDSGTKVIPNSPLVRIIEGTGSIADPITIAPGVTTDIGTLFHAANGGATTVDLSTTAGSILRFGQGGSLTSAAGSSALTLQNGIVTAGGAADTAGIVDIRNGGANAITLNSQITDNGSGAVTLKTFGNVRVGSTSADSTNSYTGGTTVNGGTLTVNASTAAGAKTGLGSGTVTVNNAALTFLTGSTLNAQSYANNFVLNNGRINSQDGVLTYSGTVDLLAGTNNTINDVYGDKLATFTNTISGAGSLTIMNTGGNAGGKVTFTGANTYTGTTTVSSGALQFAKKASLYNGATGSWTAANLTVSSGATAAFNVGAADEFTSADIDILKTLGTATGGFLSGSLLGLDTTNVAGGNFTYGSILANTNGGANAIGLNKLGLGTLTLTGVNTYTGATTIGAGTLTIGGAGSLNAGSYGGAITIATGATFNHASSAAQTLSGGISGAGALVKSSAATVTFSSQKTYTGGTTVSQGVLDLTGGGGANGTIRGVATVGTGATLRLSTGDATGYDGTTRLHTINLNGGTLDVNSTSNQTLGSATINMSGARITGIASSNLDFHVGASSLNSFASSTTSTISGVALSPLRQGNTRFEVAAGTTSSGIDLDIQSVIKNSGSGNAANAVLTISGGGTVAFSGANTITGSATQYIAVSTGTLMVGNGGTTGTLGSMNVTNNATLSFNRSDAAGTFSNIISGVGQVKQIGSGTTSLTGANTYTGDTTVAAGILAVNGSAIPNAGKLVITGGKVQPTGTEVVNTLFFGGVQQAAGTWGSTASAATYKDDTRFSGTGVVSVTTGPAGFDAWAAAKGLDGTPGKEKGPSDDPDKDGMENLTEFYLDGNPLASDTAILPTSSVDQNYLTLTFRRRDDAETLATQAIQYGSSLALWTDVTLGATSTTSPAGVIVTVTENDAATDWITVKIPRTLAASGKLFGRLNLIK